MKVGAKWDAIDIGQEAAYGAGMLVGVPQGISDSVESLSKAITNPAATYDAIKQLITSDDMSSTMSDAVKKYGVKNVSEKPTNVKGISEVEYLVPTKDRAGNLTGEYKPSPVKKTIYDPKIYTAKVMLDLEQEAAMKG